MKNTEELETLRHSAAHLLAASVLELYPGTHNAIGPSIENGFYQDFDLGDRKITEEDLQKIEEKMRDILSTWESFEIQEVSADQARKDFSHNPYKLELVEEFAKEGKSITETKQGAFLDLCKGGHVENLKENLKHFKLLSLAGAYWRGDEKNKMLTRIYGTACKTRKELDDYLLMREEAQKRDHKRLGRELELFWFDKTSPGMAYWLPKGLALYNSLYTFVRQMYDKFGYQEVATPLLNKKELYETSGHWEHYRNDMFVSPMSYITGQSKEVLSGPEVFGVKPMNCPNAMTLFGFKTRSHNDLPLRLAETSQLHRYELSGTLNGLFRIRQFRQDDAHIFVTPKLVESEFIQLMQMIREMYEPFGLTYKLRFGTRPDKALGETKDWDMSEKILRDVLEKSGEEFFEAEGEGAFYGPKVDILMKDSLGRQWQTGTVQLDIQQPKRFNLAYIDSDGSEQMPFVFHRAILGSFERFIGILTEHYAGKFPLWLAPIQIVLLPIADRHSDHAKQVVSQLHEHMIRSEVSSKSETLGSRIREATLQKVPLMGIIGDREMSENTVSLRSRDGVDHGSIPVSDLITKLRKDIDKKI